MLHKWLESGCLGDSEYSVPVSKQPIVSFTADSPKAEQTLVLFYLEETLGMERALWVESFDLCPEFF